MLRIAATAIALACWIYPVQTASAAIQSKSYQPQANEQLPIEPQSVAVAPEKVQPVVQKSTVPSVKSVPSGRHNSRADNPIEPEQLRAYLERVSSPLAPYSETISQSKYYSTIIGICWIEELKCTINPRGTNNFWGMMSHGHLISYPTMEAGIAAIDAFLAKHEAKRPTIESMRGWYCASACTNWESTVIRIKVELENL